MPPGDETGRREHEGDISGATAIVLAPEPVDPADELGVQAEAGREPEAAAVHAAEGDSPQSPLGQRAGDLAGRGNGIARQAERARQHARPPAGQETDRRLAGVAVQRLVEAAVTREDDQRIRPVRGAGELRRMPRALGEQRRHRPDPAELGLDRAHALLRHLARERVDNQDDVHRTGPSMPRELEDARGRHLAGLSPDRLCAV